MNKCACGNDFDGDNLCMPSACQWEGMSPCRCEHGVEYHDPRLPGCAECDCLGFVVAAS